MIKQYFVRMGWKRFVLMLLGNVILGMGVSIFKLANLGNDAFNAMVMSLADCTMIQYSALFAIISGILLLIELIGGRELIGIGTLVNAFLQGYIATFFYGIWTGLDWKPTGLLIQIAVMCIGVVLTAFGLSMYQSADAGVSPYDSIPIIAAKRIKKVPYFWWRIFMDGLSALICFLTGGLIGIGTLAGTFGFGPLIQFFNVHIMAGLLKEK